MITTVGIADEEPSGASFPARTWQEHDRPGAGRWMGWMNDDQPYLVGMRVELTDYGDGLVLAEFASGERVKFQLDTPFRLAPLESGQASSWLGPHGDLLARSVMVSPGADGSVELPAGAVLMRPLSGPDERNGK